MARWIVTRGKFWDSAARDLVRDQHRKTVANEKLPIKKSLEVVTAEGERYLLLKGRKIGKEISRIWGKLRPPKGGDSSGLYAVMVGEITPRKKRKTPKPPWSARRAKQIKRGTVKVLRRKDGTITGLRDRKGRFVSFK